MATDDLSARDITRHFRILGICWVAYGILRLVTAVWLAFFTSTATLMFGALLNRVPDPFTMMSAFHLFYGFLVALSAICGILGILAGLALLSGARSGRALAIFAGFLSLSSIPIGTTLGIYSLIVLLVWTTRHSSASIPAVQFRDLKRQSMTT
jgi:hypothetical protein